MRSFSGGLLVAIALVSACTGAGQDSKVTGTGIPTAASPSPSAAASTADKARFCQLARDRQAQQPTIDFATATKQQIRTAISEFIVRVRANVEESVRVAPTDIKADFVASTMATKQVSLTGDVAYFMLPELQRVGAYLAKQCGIKGP